MTNSKTAGYRLISKIVRDLEARAALTTGAELDRLNAAIAHYRAGDVLKDTVA